MPFLTTTGVLPVSCEVGLSRSVRALHIMPGLPGPEGQLHDHDYRIEIVVDREQLDDRGMVCDLDVLEAALTELTSRVEGRNLEEIRPAGAEAVTVEVFARWVHDSLSPTVAAAGGEALAVRVWETPIAFGGYHALCWDKPTADPTTTILLRHGDTQLSPEHRFSGLHDLPLSANGTRQAQAAARRLATVAPIDAVVSSPLQR